MWFTPAAATQSVTSTETPVVRSFGIAGNATSAISEQVNIIKLDPTRTYVTTGGQFLPNNVISRILQPTVVSSSATTTVEADSPVGQQAYTSPGTYSWTCPPGVTSVCVVCIGGGGGGANGWANPAGAGAGLGWKNNIPVVPGQSYTVQVGAGGGNGGDGGNSFFISLGTVAGYGGGYGGGSGTGGPNANGRGGGWFGDGGGAGGDCSSWTGGGGAGGYTGRGGNQNGLPQADSGGAAGGGAYSSTYGTGAGGGTGIFGKGATATGWFHGSSGQVFTTSQSNGGGGQGGSGGSRGLSGENPTNSTGEGGNSNIQGGSYGGGGGGPGTSWPGSPGNGGGGAVRIIWGRNLLLGIDRRFPDSSTQDL